MANPRAKRAEHLDHLRRLFREAYPGEVETRETTPKLGGVRVVNVAMLVKEGVVEWTMPGKRARAIVRSPGADDPPGDKTWNGFLY